MSPTLTRTTTPNTGKYDMQRQILLLQALFLFMLGVGQTALAADENETKFVRVPLQYIAALGQPDESSGNGAESWGLWPIDPGPRGVRLSDYENLTQVGGVAPAKWQFDSEDWWLEENGLIMEKPEFPLPPGKYVVTGGRDKAAILTVHPNDAEGNSNWELADGATIHDVTHLGCRSARYTPMTGETCSPALAPRSVFRIEPGRSMPHVAGCNKQDYAVLFIIGVEAKN